MLKTNDPTQKDESAIQVTFQPTLFLYLGTTPGEVGYRLKTLLNRAYGDVPVLRHLWIDLDQKVIPQAKPWFRAEERVELSDVDAAAVIKNIDAFPTIKDFWPTGARVPAGQLTSDGANYQMRLVGRLALFRNYAERKAGAALIDHLKRAIDALFEIKNTSSTIAKSTDKIKFQVGKNARVVIIHSTGGGSGSAMCFDIAYLCRHLLEGKHPKVTSIAILPSVIDKAVTNQNQGNIQKVFANTYAWFREENYLTGKANWRVKYPEGAPIEVTAPPFDYRYVLDIENQNNQRLNAPGDVFDMIAQAVFLQTGSPIGGEAASLDAIAGVLTMDYNGMPRSFSSLAAASLIYPKQRLLEYCANRYGSALLSEGLLGVPDNQQVHVETATLRSNLRLGDSELMGDLLTSSRVVMNREQSILKADTVAAALTQMDAQESENRAAREEARKSLDQITEKHLAKLGAGLEQEIVSLTVRRGFTFTQALLGKLLDKASAVAADGDAISFEGLKNRLHQQGISDNDVQIATREYQNARSAVDRLDNDNLDKLERAVSPNGWKKKFIQAKANLVNKSRNLNEVTLAQAAQKKAVDIYNKLAVHAGTLNTRLAGMISLTRDVSRELEEVSKQQASVSTSDAGVFEFTQEIKVDFAEYYDKRTVQANIASSFTGMIPSSETVDMKTLLDWVTGNLKKTAVEYARRYFTEALEKTSLLSTLKDMAEKAGLRPQEMIETYLDRLVKYCHPFWKYEENRGLSVSDGTSILGVEDENSSLIPDRYRDDRNFQIKTTGFLDRIDLLRTAHGMPASLLRGMKDYRVEYEELRKGRDPLHILQDMDLAPEVLPEQGKKGRDLFAIAKAFGYIVKLVNWYYYDPKKDYEKDKIKPSKEYRIANGRENAAEAFSQNEVWQAEVEELIDKEVANMGNKAAIQKLEEAINDLKKMIASTPSQDEDLRKQLEREVQALDDFQRELGIE